MGRRAKEAPKRQLPKERFCKRCGNKFEPRAAEQWVCVPCLIKPKRERV